MILRITIFATVFALLPCFLSSRLPTDSAQTPFELRGYYFTLMRMPTYGLKAWKQIIDCMAEDGGNTVILWTAGGFRSRKYPQTGAYNRDHANVRKDFVGELIDYAHKKKIRVLLGFTPFGYDGVNQMSAMHPEWRATGPDGKVTARFGFHSWGHNLCPALEDSQEFMRDYIREMVQDFYPNADGLLIESSDYAACHCVKCAGKYYDHEFRFVRGISDEVWARKRDAVISVYPHYFTGARVPGLGISAAKREFDPRWTLFFTPHSAHPDASLIKKASGAIWSDDAPARRTPSEIRAGVQRARGEGCSGYIPSFEVFTYMPTEPEEGQAYLVGKRQVPYGFSWLKDGQIPYRELTSRINRIAFREYTRNPEISEETLQAALGRELFGAESSNASVSDALFLQRALAEDRTWCRPATVISPERVRAMTVSGEFSVTKRARLQAFLVEIRNIERRYRDSAPHKEMHLLATRITEVWNGANAEMVGL